MHNVEAIKEEKSIVAHQKTQLCNFTLSHSGVNSISLYQRSCSSLAFKSFSM